jgi:hypothetical protein
VPERTRPTPARWSPASEPGASCATHSGGRL